MYGLSRLKSAVSPAAATYQKRLLRFSSLFRSIHSKHSSSAAIDYFVYVGNGGKISGQSPIENQSKRNDGNKTYKRKVLPPDLSRHTAMLTCESAADGGVCDVYLVGTDHISAIGAVEFLVGAEFHLAYEEAMKYGAKITKLLSTGLLGAVRLLCPENVTKEMREMDDCEMLPPAFQVISKRCPAFVETVVHERDQYMSATLLRVGREHNSVVAVVGRGHLVGIQKNWKQPVDLKKLLSVPSEKKRMGSILYYVGATVYIISAIYRSINT